MFVERSSIQQYLICNVKLFVYDTKLIVSDWETPIQYKDRDPVWCDVLRSYP